MGHPKPALSSAEPKPHLRTFSRSLPMTLLRARETLVALFRPVLGRNDLTEQQWRVLRFLAENGPARPSDVSVATKIHVSSLSRIMSALRARGLISRAEDAGDMRAVLVSITARGKGLVCEIGPELERVYEEIERTIGREDIETLTLLAGRIETVFRDD